MINEIWIPTVTGPSGITDEDILFGAAACTAINTVNRIIKK